MEIDNNKNIHNNFYKFLERQNTFKSLCKEINLNIKKYYIIVVKDRVLVEYSSIEEVHLSLLGIFMMYEIA